MTETSFEDVVTLFLCERTSVTFSNGIISFETPNDRDVSRGMQFYEKTARNDWSGMAGATMTGEPPPFRREVYFRPWAFALAIVNATRCKYSRRRMGRLHLPQQNIDAVESLAIRIHREGKLSGYPPAVWIFIVLRLKTQKTPSCLPGMTGSDLAQSINVTESKHLLDRKVYFRSLECAITRASSRQL